MDSALDQHLDPTRTPKPPPRPEAPAKEQAAPETVARTAAGLAGYPSLILVLTVAMLIVGLRLFQLETLQEDLYGDIQIVYVYVERVLAGEWPTYFDLSAGPLYHYAIAPIVALFGLSYPSLKIASAAVSLGVLLATTALARRLVDDRFALLAALVAGVSSWLLIFSRLGNSQIMVPLLTTAALWLAVRVAQDRRRADVVACAVVSALGLYCYPQTFVLPAVSFITLLCLSRTAGPIPRDRLVLFAIVTAVCTVPFGFIVARDPANFIDGYIGGKIVGEQHPLAALAGNVLRAALAFHVEGDAIFRSNPPRMPHLDAISGVLALAGVAYWLMPGRRRWAPALLVPLVLLQAPSVLVLGRPEEVPSASRTLGVAPICYVLAASGVWWLLEASRRWRRPWLSAAAAGLLLAGIVGLNGQRYFVDYIGGLPYQNTSVGAHIAAYADSLPADTTVYLVGCCWEHSMPETPYVQKMMRRPDQLVELRPEDLTCERLDEIGPSAVLVWSFHEALPAPGLAPCAERLPAQTFVSDRDLPVFRGAAVLPGG